MMLRYPHSKPSRCPVCQCRNLKEWPGIQDTFENYTVYAWQCIQCGRVIEPRGWKADVSEPQRIVLLPGELQELRQTASAT